MEETVHDLNTKIRQRKKSMTTSDKYEVEGYFNFKTSRNNIIYNLFYSNISEFSGKLEGMHAEVTYKHPYKICTNLVEGKLLQVF